jgi:SsrA-binding protein
MANKKKGDDGRKIIADNRKARHAYSIESTLEAGLVLVGSEVKSLRTGKATIGESYAQAKDGELFLLNAYIPEYMKASRFNHEPRRPRKLCAGTKYEDCRPQFSAKA